MKNNTIVNILRFSIRYFIPVIIVYAFVVLNFSESVFYNDEARYIEYAKRLLQGFYVPEGYTFIANGPGYPIVIAPIVFFTENPIFIRLLNVFFMYFAVFYLYKTLIYLNVKDTFALIAAYSLAFLFPRFLKETPSVLTEVFTGFLVVIFTYYALKYFKEKKRKYLFITAFLLGFIALTKVIFGYVMLVSLIVLIIVYLFKRKTPSFYKKSIVIILLAFLVTLPYLIYTYNLTGKFFHWAGTGPSTLYWMTSPYENEYGSWINIGRAFSGTDLSKKHPQGKVYFQYAEVFDSVIAKNHREFFESIMNNSKVDFGDAQIAKSIENIRTYPIKYFKNWIANVSRMFLNYPFSYRMANMQDVLPHIFSIPLIFLFLISLYPAYKHRKRVSPGLFFTGLIFLFYFLGSSVVSAYSRMSVPIIPFMILFSTYSITSFVDITLKKVDEEQ